MYTFRNCLPFDYTMTCVSTQDEDGHSHSLLEPAWGAGQDPGSETTIEGELHFVRLQRYQYLLLHRSPRKPGAWERLGSMDLSPRTAIVEWDGSLVAMFEEQFDVASHRSEIEIV